MGRTSPTAEPLATIWELSDKLWARIEPIRLEDAPPPPKEHGGRPRIDWRQAINGIIFRLRTGCQWNRLPERFGDDSSIHRWFGRWCRNGLFVRIRAALVEECDEMGAVDWKWQAADGMLGKARFGGKETGKNPTDRVKPGTKKSLIVEADAGPLGVVLAGANVPDFKLLGETIEAVVVERLVRYEKHAVNYLGLIQLACGLLWYRRLHRISAA